MYLNYIKAFKHEQYPILKAYIQNMKSFDYKIIKLKKQVSSTTKYIILNAWEKYDDMLQFVAFKLKSQGQAKKATKSV